MVGWSEASKCQALTKVFEDAYKSPLSIIVLDDIERLLDYVSIGPRFSNVTLQALLVLLKRLPPEGHKLMVIGTTSESAMMEEMSVAAQFNVKLNVPLLNHDETRQVLQELDAFAPHELSSAVALLDEAMPIKKLLMLLEMARQGGAKAGAKGANSRLTFARFLEARARHRRHMRCALRYDKLVCPRRRACVSDDEGPK